MKCSKTQWQEDNGSSTRLWVGVQNIRSICVVAVSAGQNISASEESQRGASHAAVPQINYAGLWQRRSWVLFCWGLICIRELAGFSHQSPQKPDLPPSCAFPPGPYSLPCRWWVQWALVDLWGRQDTGSRKSTLLINWLNSLICSLKNENPVIVYSPMPMESLLKQRCSIFLNNRRCTCTHVQTYVPIYELMLLA